MEILICITSLVVGYLLRKYQPNLTKSCKPPMAEYLDTDKLFDNRCSFARRQQAP